MEIIHDSRKEIHFSRSENMQVVYFYWKN
jgi:hypothetical protein